MLAAESALGFHPWRALSSAQVATRVTAENATCLESRSPRKGTDRPSDNRASVTYLPEAARGVSIVVALEKSGFPRPCSEEVEVVLVTALAGDEVCVQAPAGTHRIVVAGLIRRFLDGGVVDVLLDCAIGISRVDQ